MRTQGWFIWLLATIVALPTFGCGGMSTREKTTAGGAGAGALVGGIIGHQSGKTAQGALIGGAIGAIGGYVVGTKVEKNEAEAKAAAAKNDPRARAEALFQQANSTGDRKNSIALYTQAIRLDPTQPAYYNNRGLAYLDLGDRESARSDFAQALSVNPSYQPAQDNLRRLQHTGGN